MTLAHMKSSNRWLIAAPDKTPHYIDGSKRRGRLDSAEDLGRLSTYDSAVSALGSHPPGWLLGFALGPDGQGGNWQGIDFDAIEDNLLSVLVDSLPGYVETSPSGMGLHAIGYGRTFRTLGPNGSGIEAYSGGRYFTVTQSTIRDSELVCLADHVETKLAGLHKSCATSALSSAAKVEPAAVRVSAQVIADLQSALCHVSSDEYGTWIAIGHALKSTGDAGRALWLEWSARSAKFDMSAAVGKWESFAPTQTGYQAVFARAQAEDWQNHTSSAAIFAQFAGEPPHSEAAIVATPFLAPESFDIPPRPWVFGRWLLRGTVATVIAPGGTGKSALMVGVGLSLATGREILGKSVWAGPRRVWLWNLEDDRDELTRQIVAASLHHGVRSREYAGRLFLNDAASSLCMATKERDGLRFNVPVVDAMIAEISKHEIDVVIIDPFVSSHRAEENDNGQIDAIAKLWARLARETKCSVVLVHHSRKLSGQQVDAESARGASALGNAARTVLVLNRMEKGEAARFGVREENRRSYIRVTNDKSNRAPAGAADWFRLTSVRLANGGADGGDDIGVIERWTPPDANVTALEYDNLVRAKVQTAISAGEWREHLSAKNWAGHAVAEIIGADLTNPSDKQRVKFLLADMISKRQLQTAKGLDANRHQRDFVVMGENISKACDSPAW